MFNSQAITSQSCNVCTKSIEAARSAKAMRHHRHVSASWKQYQCLLLIIGFVSARLESRLRPARISLCETYMSLVFVLQYYLFGGLVISWYWLDNVLHAQPHHTWNVRLRNIESVRIDVAIPVAVTNCNHIPSPSRWVKSCDIIRFVYPVTADSVVYWRRHVEEQYKEPSCAGLHYIHYPIWLCSHPCWHRVGDAQM